MKFQASGGNSQGQLVFTTHNTELLEGDLLRRDQVWLTDKGTNGATELYSLWDFKENKPRVGENLRKGYLEGRYRGVPILESI